jgi:hypothetical protein
MVLIFFTDLLTTFLKSAPSTLSKKHLLTFSFEGLFKFLHHLKKAFNTCAAIFLFLFCLELYAHLTFYSI